jgi:NAD(P)-dependent dehydrogenase (short-subunit alcohol dehydrogenase family)
MAEGIAADARLNGIATEEAVKQATARIPLGRLAAPEDIANVVVFLASPRSGHVSGAILTVDGASTPMVV